MIFVITKMPKDVTGRIIEIGYDCVYVAYNKLYLATIVGFTDNKVCVQEILKYTELFCNMMTDHNTNLLHKLIISSLFPKY